MAVAGSNRLSLTSFALSDSLSDFVTWIALTNHVDTTAAANHLTVRMAIFKRPNGRNYFHFNELQVSMRITPPKRTIANLAVGSDLFRLTSDRLTSGIALRDLLRVFDYPVGFGNRVVYRCPNAWQRQNTVIFVAAKPRKRNLISSYIHADCLF